MNIFYLDENPQLAAQYHNDSHVRKMILEYAQMLSTAHRVLDGEEYYEAGKSGRRIKRWRLSDERENLLYKATHINHPATKWVREGVLHYDYLYQLFCNLCDEFEYRWNKKHATDLKLRAILGTPPHNIKIHVQSSPPLTMDEEYKFDDPIEAYKNFYRQGKSHLALWTKREKPEWYEKVT